MSSDDAYRTQGRVNVYRLTSASMRLAYIGAGVLVVLAIAAAIYSLTFLSSPSAGLLIAVTAMVDAILLGGAAIIFGARRYVRLEISETGVRYVSLGYTVETPWSNVSGIAHTLMGTATGDALRLREGSPGVQGTLLRAAAILAVFQGQAVAADAYDRAIPLEPFASPLRGSPLLEDLRRHVPEVVAEYERRGRR